MPVLFNETVIQGTISGGSITYDYALKDNDRLLAAATFSGTGISGRVKLMGSGDGINFQDIPDSVEDFSASGSWLADMTGINYSHVRLVCQSISGSITFQGMIRIIRPPTIGK